MVITLAFLIFFFFKQKTAYEITRRDWSSDVCSSDLDPAGYDGLVLPGGVANPDQLRTVPRAVEFLREFFSEGKPVGVICHGPWTLVEADLVRDRTLTSWPSLRSNIRNAGG